MSKRKKKLITGVVCICITAGLLLSYYAYANNQKVEMLADNLEMSELNATAIMNEAAKNFDTDYEKLSEYIGTLVMMNVEQSTKSILDELLGDGYDAYEILAVYKFCRGTDCDVSTVKQVLDLKDSFTGPHWIENAYNYITNNKYGVLDYEQLCEYLNNGYTTEDIIAANMLCRKGKYTIDDILHKVGDGETWTNLYNDIENIATSFSGSTPERNASDIIEMLELKNNYGVTDETLSSLNSSEKIADFKQAVEEKHIELTTTLLSAVTIENEVTE